VEVERHDRRQHAVNGLLNTPGFDQLDFSAVKVVVGGGAAVQKPGRALAAGDRTLHHRSLRPDGELARCLRPSPGVALERDHRLPIPSTELSIRDDSFNELPVWTGEGDLEQHTGEICIRGRR